MPMKKKISIVHPFLIQYGGAEKVVLDMAKHFAIKYGECNLYTSVFDKSFERVINRVKGLTVISLKQTVFGKAIFGNKFNPFLLIDMLRLSLKIKKSDFIITINWPSNIATYLSKTFFNNLITPSLFLCLEPDHGLHHRKMITSQYLSSNPITIKLISIILFPFQALDKFIVNKEKIILTFSKYAQQTVKLVFGNTAYTRTFPLLHDYIDIDAKQIINKMPRTHITTFFSICRLEKSKNVDIIIKAFKLLQDKNKNLRLFIGGTGPEETKLKKLAEGMKTVIFLGFIKDKDLRQYYINSDIFIFAGTRESAGPLTLIEAMACENAIIAPDEGGPIEIIENGKDGLFFKARNINSLYEKMNYLTENSAIRRILGKRARQKVLISYSARHFFYRLDSVIEQPDRFIF